MSDPTTTSRAARESLARGLSALQGDPSVPAHLVELAAPIAQAMGALHQIEKTGQLAPHAEVALNNVRGALNKLQAQPASHPAVAAAMEAVAGSLSLVHSLGKMANGPAPGPAPAPAYQQPPIAQHAAPQQQQAYAPPPQQQQVAPAFPQVARDPFAATAPAPPVAFGPPPGTPPPGFHAAPAPQAQGRPPGPVPSPPAAGGNVQVISADLGAHSPTNFYKGLSGNDIIDHGGLFVSTYVPPKLGTPVRLKVSLPGGYEFEANAVVKWVREQGGDAPPGFGAQIIQITPEARQLIYRYVRNREPLFHDDF